MNKSQAAADIVRHALPIVPFEGWSRETLEQAAVSAGYKKEDVVRLFPGGAIDAVDEFSRLGDANMLAALQSRDLSTMKIRERIAAAVRVRIEMHDTHREALRKAVAMHTLPFYLNRGLRTLYETVDAMWRAAGDTATDFNFYTKRLLLAGVYSSTLLYWLDDKSQGGKASWEFLARRIDNVMQIQKLKGSLFRRRA